MMQQYNHNEQEEIVKLKTNYETQKKLLYKIKEINTQMEKFFNANKSVDAIALITNREQEIVKIKELAKESKELVSSIENYPVSDKDKIMLDSSFSEISNQAQEIVEMDKKLQALMEKEKKQIIKELEKVHTGHKLNVAYVPNIEQIEGFFIDKMK